MEQRQWAAFTKRATAAPGAPASDGETPSLWFDPPTHNQDRRPLLTRQRVVTEALAAIAQDGVQALTMRRLAGRLGVVPGALYHHVRNKQQLQDLVLDNVLAEVDVHLDSSLDWTGQLKVLAHRLRQVLEAHPGVAGILKTRDPLGPHSLALAEAFLEPLQAAGFGDRQAGVAFFHQDPAAPVLPLPAPRPFSRPGDPGRARLGRQPQRAVHRRPRRADRRA
jgi:AcrR family transcriptional regulator